MDTTSENDLKSETTISISDVVPTKKHERRVFIFLTIFLAPIFTFMLIGGYGFLVWMSQLILGPPGGH